MDKQDNFKATSIKDLNEKKQLQTGWDDSSLLRNVDPAKQFSRSQTVKCKTNKWKRPQLSSKLVENEDQMFIPSYGSVSAIRIDSQTSCLNAIKILLEKFHVRVFWF